MNHIPKILLWLPAALWYRVIWNFSAQSTGVSGDLSDRLLWRLLALLSPAFAAGDVTAQNAAVELLSFFERKAAHMFLYFVLILLLWLALAPLLRSKGRQVLGAAVLCAVLAALDEYHQYLVPGRSGQVRDVAIDLTGAAIALLLDLLVGWSVRRWRAGTPGLSARLPVRAALLRACLQSLVPACALALFLAPALVPAAGLLSLLGCLLLGVVQLTAGFLKQSVKR